jgi:FtsH-binding integral membrane protein
MENRNVSFVNVMRNRDFNPDVTYTQVRPLVKWTYLWMMVGLIVTTATAFFTVNSPALLELLMSPALFVAIILQFVVVIALSAAMQRLSPGVAAGMFIGYAALTGFTLSGVLLVYTASSIVTAFVATVALFGALAFFAFTTELDLSRIGNILMVALIGLVVAMLINLFLGSSLIDYVISLAGVLIFSGLTAYSNQKLKRLAAMPELQENGALMARMSIFMALELYLDFINLFLFILRLLGGSRSN